VRLLLIGHGRMGTLVERLAASYGCEIGGVVTEESGERAIERGEFGPLDVAIDFSLAEAVPANLVQLASRQLSVVIGATGWQAREAELRDIAVGAGIGVLASANFSVGMHIFQLAVASAAARFAAQRDYGAWIHETHHAAKKDAPSGTALMLKAGMEQAGYLRTIDVSSTRAGHAPGIHTVGFDGPSDAVTFTHEVRDRAVFARGALEAAKWLKGRRGWFTMKDMLASGPLVNADVTP
jgi:4-hydroxy-tetrahydrodipicolinate reductase